MRMARNKCCEYPGSLQAFPAVVLHLPGCNNSNLIVCRGRGRPDLDAVSDVKPSLSTAADGGHVVPCAVWYLGIRTSRLSG